MPELSISNCSSEVKNENRNGDHSNGSRMMLDVTHGTKPTPASTSSKPGRCPMPTRKQRLKRERGAELAAKLEVKTHRKAIRTANRNGAKKIYD